MTPEDKQYRAALSAAKRNYPLNDDEMFSMKEPVFPIIELRKCYATFIETHHLGSAADLFYYLLKQSKTEEQVEKQLFNRFVYGDIEDIKFGAWLGTNGWQPYDGQDRWINLKHNNSVLSLRELFADYKKQNKTL